MGALSLRWRFLAGTWLVVLVVSGLFSFMLYTTQRREYMAGVDAKLHTGVHMARSLVGSDFHDRLAGPESLSPEEYLSIVERYNAICLETDFQYLWSNLFLEDGVIVFTTGTSASKDASQGDHALFFDVHGDPAAFDPVRTADRPTYSTFENEWGTGRMLLVPFRDAQGRTYVFGASIAIDDLAARLAETRRRAVVVFLTMLLLGGGVSLLLGHITARPLQRLRLTTRAIAGGDYGAEVKVRGGGEEMESLAESVNRMSRIILEDITKRQRTEEALVRAKEEADAANRAKSEFLANMSHEIRTPLNAVLGLGRLLAETPLDERQRDYLGKINRSSRLLLGVINDVLDFSKIEAGGLELDCRPFSLEDALEDARVVFSGVAREKGLELVLDADPDIPHAVVGDSMRIGQVLTNLLGNAVKFTESGHVTLRIGRLPMNEEESRKSGVDSNAICLLRFAVEDSGIGMDESQMARLFRPFSQADGSTTRKYGGSGLGLVISRRLVEAMGGSLEVTSAPGEGSRFFFTLALPVASEARGVVARSRPLPDGMSFLVVDDQETARAVLRRILESWNARVEEAGSGTEAIEAVLAAERRGESFDFILMDWKMPGELDGLATIRHLHGLYENGTLKGPETPAFVISAYDREDLPNDDPPVYRAFLSKPVTASELFDAMMEATGGALETPRPEDRGSVPSFDGYTVLLVEDNELNREVATRFIQKTGARVVTAVNGRDALDLLEEMRVDLVLMDLQMPVMDGFDATREIRRREAERGGSRLPVVALSAAVMDDDKMRAAEAGVDGHLPKPIDERDLYRLMGAHLKSEGVAPTAVPRSAEEEFPAVEGFDPRRGFSAAQGDVALYAKLLRGFDAQLAGLFSSLTEGVRSLDMAESQQLAHTLKGTAATVGAVRTAAVAAEVDRACRAGEPPAEATIRELREAMAEARRGIATFFAASPEAVAEVPPLDEQEGHEAVRRLLAALRESELAEDDLLERSLRFLRARAGGERTEALRGMIDRFEMDDAATLLEQLEKELDKDA